MVDPFYRVLRPLLFRMDAERAHHLAMANAARLDPAATGIVKSLIGLLLGRVPGGLERELMGLRFPSPIGLAAGFDKNGVAPHFWAAMGFGFAELGTVTARAQPGNPPPRLFRLVEDRAVVNRLGFNNAGATVVARELAQRRQKPCAVPIGINIGCSRVAMGDPGRELADLQESTRLLAPLADYLAINVSSPNTPGLRDLQQPPRLAELVRGVLRTAGESVDRVPPLLVKIAPDLADDAIAAIVDAALGAGASGLIATNTTLSRAGCRSARAQEPGGLSGPPLRRRSTEVVARVRERAGIGPVVIGVGGISRVTDVKEKLEAGADLVELYTGLIFEGPGLPLRLARHLAREAGHDRKGA